MLMIKSAERNDFYAWSQLYKQYLDFYQTMLTDEQLITLWDWFFDDEKKMYCVIASLKGSPVGLVHFREFLRPIKASVGIFMDDLFVESTHRSQGIAPELIKYVSAFALQKNIPIVRWITASDHHHAMKVYDNLAIKTQWITYDMSSS